MSGQYTILGQVQYTVSRAFLPKTIWKCRYGTTTEEHELEFHFKDSHFHDGSLQYVSNGAEVMACRSMRTKKLREIILGPTVWELLENEKPFATVTSNSLGICIRTTQGEELILSPYEMHVEKESHAISWDHRNITMNFALNSTALIYPMFFCMVYMIDRNLFHTS